MILTCEVALWFQFVFPMSFDVENPFLYLLAVFFIFGEIPFGFAMIFYSQLCRFIGFLWQIQTCTHDHFNVLSVPLGIPAIMLVLCLQGGFSKLCSYPYPYYLHLQFSYASFLITMSFSFFRPFRFHKLRRLSKFAFLFGLFCLR